MTETIRDCSRIDTLRASGIEPALFSFYAFTEDTIASIQGNRPIYEFHPAELDDARDCCTVQQLAAMYLDDICRVQQRGPYFLCGYSFGGLVAYEIAALLEKEGKKVTLLALFDTSHPKLIRNLSPIQFARFRVTYLIDRLFKYGGNLISGRLMNVRADVRQFIVPRLRAIAWRVIRAVFRAANRPIPKTMLSKSQAITVAWRSYTPGICSTKLVLFRAERRGIEYNSDMTLGWKACATDIEVHIVPGRHEDMMKMPYVRVLVEKLNPYLTRADNRHRT